MKAIIHPKLANLLFISNLLSCQFEKPFLFQFFLCILMYSQVAIDPN